MSSDWQKLADLWYRKRDVYTTLWEDDPERLQLSVVAGASNGGPLATVRNEHLFQPLRGSLQPELQTWTTAGRPIASAPWPHTGLVSMAWGFQDVLVCVFDCGKVRTFDVMCQPLNAFTVDDRIVLDGGVAQVAHWSTGIALLTKKSTLFVNASISRSGDACLRYPDLKVGRAPLSLCVLPPPEEDSDDVRVVVGTAEGPVMVVDRQGCKNLGIDEGPYMAFAVSSNGRLLACLSERGVFKVLSVGDELHVLDVAHIECRKRPRQMVWCGDDCIVLYLAVPTPSSGLQHVLFVGGPQNDWIPYQYDGPLHVVPECDGCRVVGSRKVEFVQRVPQSTESIFSIGNCDPPAMLCYALDRYEKGDVCAQESLRLIKDDLVDATATCTDAAQHERDPEVAKNLLNSAVFGRHFLGEQPSPGRFVETCRNLRICDNLWKAPIDMPITVPQLDRLGMAGLVARLAERHHYLLAARICDWVGHRPDSVLLHWACAKVRRASTNISDAQLCDILLAKLQGCRGARFADVARAAADASRPHLAAMLLDHEPCAAAQVSVLLQLSQGADEDGARMMTLLAVERAAATHDPDLVHAVLTSLCGGDPCSRGADMQAVVKATKERPAEMRPVVDALWDTLLRAGQLERARSFYQEIGNARGAAFSAVHQVFNQRTVEDRNKWLRFAKDFFSHCDEGAAEPERCTMLFFSQMCGEQGELLKTQASLEEMATTKRWRGGPHRFAGLSLVETIRKLVEVGEIEEADTLHTKLNLSERRYWRIKVNALEAAGNLTELNMMATHRTSPVGHELVVEAFLKHGRNDLALPFVPKVKSSELQAKFYTRMGMPEEAQAALAKRDERAGPGRLLKDMLRLS